MDISNIKPPLLNLPHVGDVRLWILTLNSMTWVKENSELEAHQFIRAYLEKQAVHDDGSSVDMSDITNEQLLEIVQVLATADRNEIRSSNSDDDGDDVEKIISVDDFKSHLQKRVEASNKRMTQIVQSSLGHFHDSNGTKALMDSLKSPSMRLQEMLDPPGMRAMRNMIYPAGLSVAQALVSPTIPEIFNSVIWSNSALITAKKLRGPDIWSIQRQLSNLSASLTLRNDYATTIAQITKEFSAVNATQKALIKATRPNTLDRAYLESSLKQPGFEMTAQAALSGMASKAPAAEILEHYSDKPSDKVTMLGAARESIQGLDAIAENDTAALESLANSVPSKMSAIEIIHIALLIQFIQLTLTALMYYAATTDNGDEVIQEGFTVIQEYLDETQRQYELDHYKYKHDRILTSRYHLREGPSTTTSSLTILMPDRIVNVKKTDGNWAYVEVYPYGNEPSVYGWVYRGGLRPV